MIRRLQRKTSAPDPQTASRRLGPHAQPAHSASAPELSPTRAAPHRATPAVHRTLTRTQSAPAGLLRAPLSPTRSSRCGSLVGHDGNAELPRVPTAPDLRAPHRHLPTDEASGPLRQRLADDRANQWMRGQWVASGPHANRGPVAQVAPKLTQALWFDGMSMGYTPVIHPGRHLATAPMFLLSDGYIGFNPDLVFTGNNGDQRVIDPFVGVWNSMIGGGASLGAYRRAMHLGVRAGAQASVTAQGTSRSVLQGPAPAATCRHTFTHRFGITASIYSALAGFGFSRILGKLFERGFLTQRSYTTTLPVEVSVALDDSDNLQQDSSWRLVRWLRQFVAEVRGRTPLPEPTLDRLDRLKAGDVYTETREQTQAFMPPAPGIPLASIGWQRSHILRRQITVARTQASQYSVTVRQDRTARSGWFGVVPGGPFYDRGKTAPRSCRYTLRFDDLASCQRAVAALSDLKVDLTESVQACAAPVENEVHFDGMISGHEMGLRFCLFPRDLWQEMLPRGFGMGLSHHRSRTELNVHRPERGAKGERIVRTHRLYSSEKERVGGPSGCRESSVHALVSPAEAQAPALELVANFSFSRATPAQLNREMVAPLQAAFKAAGAPLPPWLRFFASGEAPSSRTLGLSCTWDAVELAGWEPAALAQATVRLGAAGKALGAAFTAQPAPAPARAHAVARFVQHTGLAGLAAIYAFSCQQQRTRQQAVRPMGMETTCGAYARLQDEPTRLERRFDRPLQPLLDVQQQPEGLRRRVREVEQALGEVEQTRALVADDPLLGEAERGAKAQLCEVATLRLQRLLRLDAPSHAARLSQNKLMRQLIRLAPYAAAERERYLHLFDLDAQRLVRKARDLRCTSRHAATALPDLEPLRTRVRAQIDARVEFFQSDLLLSRSQRELQRGALSASLALLAEEGCQLAGVADDRRTQDARTDTLRRLGKATAPKPTFFAPRRQTKGHDDEGRVLKLTRQTQASVADLARLDHVCDATRLRAYGRSLRQQVISLRTDNPTVARDRAQLLTQLSAWEDGIHLAAARGSTATRTLADNLAAHGRIRDVEA